MTGELEPAHAAAEQTLCTRPVPGEERPAIALLYSPVASPTCMLPPYKTSSVIWPKNARLAMYDGVPQAEMHA